MTNNTDKDAPGLTVQIKSQTDTELVVEYKVTNSGPNSVYLFNKLFQSFDPAKGFMIDDGLCYVEEVDEEIILSRKIFPVPPYTRVYMPNVPCVTRLDPAAVFSEKIQLLLPLRANNPYLDTSGKRQERRPRKLPCRLDIGYFTAVAGTHALAQKIRSTQGPQLRFYPFNASGQKILKSDRFASMVTLQN